MFLRASGLRTSSSPLHGQERSWTPCKLSSHLSFWPLVVSTWLPSSVPKDFSPDLRWFFFSPLSGAQQRAGNAETELLSPPQNLLSLSRIFFSFTAGERETTQHRKITKLRNECSYMISVLARKLKFLARRVLLNVERELFHRSSDKK